MVSEYEVDVRSRDTASIVAQAIGAICGCALNGLALADTENLFAEKLDDTAVDPVEEKRGGK